MIMNTKAIESTILAFSKNKGTLCPSGCPLVIPKCDGPVIELWLATREDSAASAFLAVQ